jgi:hypothetical protein
MLSPKMKSKSVEKSHQINYRMSHLVPTHHVTPHISHADKKRLENAGVDMGTKNSPRRSLDTEASSPPPRELSRKGSVSGAALQPRELSRKGSVSGDNMMVSKRLNRHGSFGSIDGGGRDVCDLSQKDLGKQVGVSHSPSAMTVGPMSSRRSPPDSEDEKYTASSPSVSPRPRSPSLSRIPSLSDVGVPGLHPDSIPHGSQAALGAMSHLPPPTISPRRR